MNIDLLFTKSDEAGLIASENLMKKASGVVLDSETGILTLEYVDADYMELNIPLERQFADMLAHAPFIHIGAVKNGNIAQAYQIPLMLLDDPYRGSMNRDVENEGQSPLVAFGAFVKNCVTGQPAHRDDLGDEDSMGCVLGDDTPTSLQFAPHLEKRQAMEVGVKKPANAPKGYSGPKNPSR